MERKLFLISDLKSYNDFCCCQTLRGKILMIVEFNRSAVKPVECVKQGWALIKEQYWLFFGIVLVGLLIAGFGPFGVLLGPMVCGIYIALFKKMRGEVVTFDLLFKGFDHFAAGAITGILQTLPMMLVAFVLYIPMIIFYMSQISSMQRGQRVDPNIFFTGMLAYEIPAYIVIIALSVIVHILFIFSYPLIVERNMKAIDAIKLSFRAAFGNIGGLIGLMLLQIALTFAGMLACFVGIYLIMPIYYAADAVAFKQVFPMQESFTDGPPPPPKEWV